MPPDPALSAAHDYTTIVQKSPPRHKARLGTADSVDVALVRRGNQNEEQALLADAHARIAALERQLEAQAGFDALTGLLSLSRFRAQLDIEVQRARRHGRPLTAAIL